MKNTTSESKQFLLFNISGGIGTFLFYCLYEFLFSAFEGYVMDRRATIAWCVSYMCSIAWQHSLHRYIVFGSQGNFWKSLFWTYISYTLSLILSTVANDVLTMSLGVNHRVAWVLTLVATGVLNFFTLKNAFADSSTKQV